MRSFLQVEKKLVKPKQKKDCAGAPCAYGVIILDEGGDEGISSNTDSAIRDYSPAVPPLLSRQQAWECFPGHTANKSVAITISITHGSHCKGQGGGSHRIPNYTPTAHLRIRPVKSRRPTDSE